MAVQVLNKNKKKKGLSWRGALFLIVLLTPFWMLLAWYLTPGRKLVVAIVDKTVVKKPGQEHLSLHWILHQQKFTKNDKELYDINKDYFGFFPLEKERYELKGLERFNEEQLQQLSADADIAYITDAYGVFKNEWFKEGNPSDRSGIVYGGMSEQDLTFLEYMKDRKKLIITEFNAIGSPTSIRNRERFQQTFRMHWSGWIGRYFESLDTTINKELPRWLIDGYKRTNDGSWPFTQSGIAFIHEANDQIVILEGNRDLKEPMPYIVSSNKAMTEYGIPERIKYSFWFDVIGYDSAVNEAIAHFEIQPNEKGRAILQKNGIPSRFPAITRHLGDDYQFYYFSADFCDNPISLTTSYFKGIGFFDWMMYTSREPLERKSFFWKVYRPLMTRILNNRYRLLHP
jgi:hypothetical protein